MTGRVVCQVGGAGEAICDTSNHSADSFIYWSGNRFSVEDDKEFYSMTEVSWYGACLFANWRSTQVGRTPCYDPTTFDCNFLADGWRLPTEAEWEYAARGGEHNPYYQYPWGSNTITTVDANYDNTWGGAYEVGFYYAPNGYGLYNKAGDVGEFCYDWYDEDYYSTSPVVNPVCLVPNGLFNDERNYGVGFRLVANWR